MIKVNIIKLFKKAINPKFADMVNKIHYNNYVNTKLLKGKI